MIILTWLWALVLILLALDIPSEAVARGKKFVPSGLQSSTLQFSYTGQSRDRIIDAVLSSSDQVCERQCESP